MQPHHFPNTPPKWWPKGEAWPPGPRHTPNWRNLRGRFMRRVGCGLLLLVTLAAIGLAAIAWLVFSWLTGGELAGRLGLPALIGAGTALLVVVVVVGWVVRSLGWTALPIGDLLDAAGRVAEGDYTPQVRERGTREIRSLARAFNEMTARLRANDAQRRNLLADVTHELRTPLTVIQGNLEGMLDGIYPADSRRLNDLLEETRLLSRVIDDLRTLSLAESGALKLELQPVSLADLIEQAAAGFEAQASRAGVAIQVAVQPGLPLVEVDPERIREVLANLLNNALRYTPAGGTIHLRGWIEPGDELRARVAVQDNGVGIAAQDLPHIFDRFYKSADSRGSGLGLAICKSLVGAHGGEIFAESRPGSGTTLWFTLPLTGGSHNL